MQSLKNERPKLQGRNTNGFLRRTYFQFFLSKVSLRLVVECVVCVRLARYKHFVTGSTFIHSILYPSSKPIIYVLSPPRCQPDRCFCSQLIHFHICAVLCKRYFLTMAFTYCICNHYIICIICFTIFSCKIYILLLSFILFIFVIII